jgi:hypothetical protein
MADYDKGIQRAQFQAILRRFHIPFSRCLRHMLGNSSKAGNTISDDDVQAQVYRMAKSRSQEIFENRLSDDHELSPGVAAWFDTHRHLYAAYVFLDLKRRRFGKLLSNEAECINRF